MRSCCVFCGSSPGRRPAYREAAERLGGELAQRRIRLVYGGAQVGLMGAVADAVLAAGGEAIGVIPRLLAAKEVMHEGLTELHVVESMHERKSKMADLSEGFIALPGGMGTFEEMFETLTWAQLGVHQHPIGLLDVDGYYAPLRQQLDRAVEERFLKAEHRELLLIDAEPASLLERLAIYQPVGGPKWLDRETT